MRLFTTPTRMEVRRGISVPEPVFRWLMDSLHIKQMDPCGVIYLIESPLLTELCRRLTLLKLAEFSTCAELFEMPDIKRRMDLLEMGAWNELYQQAPAGKLKKFYLIKAIKLRLALQMISIPK